MARIRLMLLCFLALVPVAPAAGSSGQPPCRNLTGVRPARCPLAVEVHVTQASMKNVAASEVAVSAGCAAGSVLVGGGILQDKLDGTQPINGLRIHGTIPSGRAWSAIGGFGGQSEPGDQV